MRGPGRSLIGGILIWRQIVLFAAICGTPAGSGTAATLSCSAAGCLAEPNASQYVLAINSWRQLETSRPAGGVVSSISRTANTSHSDAGFAGVIMRCNDNGDVDLVLVLLENFPPKATVNVRFGTEFGPKQYPAKVLGTGLELLLEQNSVPVSAILRNLKELQIDIEGPQQPIHGVVDLDGIQEALALLRTKCLRR